MTLLPPYLPAAPSPSTLKERVEAFWQWYAVNAAELFETIEQGKCSDLQPSISAVIDALLPRMAWVFGPGAEGVGHSFTLTPEASPYRRLVSQYWLAKAPQLQGWTFYSSRQAGQVSAGVAIGIDGIKYKPEEIWVTPWVDEHHEMVDLRIWHAAFGHAPHQHRELITFLWLDEILGEESVHNWIGEIKFGDEKLSEAISLLELPEYIANLELKHGWQKYPPGATYSSYRLPEQAAGAETDTEGVPQLRSDIVAGTTLLFNAVSDFPMAENPLAAWGAELIMIVLRTDQLPAKGQVAKRGELEDALDEVLRQHHAGLVLGGATGSLHSYIDLALYDGECSKQLVLDVLAAGEFGDSAWLTSFVQSSQPPNQPDVEDG